MQDGKTYNVERVAPCSPVVTSHLAHLWWHHTLLTWERTAPCSPVVTSHLLTWERTTPCSFVVTSHLAHLRTNVTLLTCGVTAVKEFFNSTESRRSMERLEARSLSWPWPLTSFLEVTETSMRSRGTLTSANRFAGAYRRWYSVFSACLSIND